MSLLGIDVGTTGCKAVVFSGEGAILASAYAEYNVARPQPGQATLDSSEVWAKIKSTIARAVVNTPAGDQVTALSVASMGEAVVPVSEDRRILGPSILIVDNRGADQATRLRGKIDDISCYQITGNPVGNQYGLTKLMWIKDCEPELYDKTYQFLNWAGFVSFMLGAEPHADFSLANRMLLFDLERETWSDEMISIAGLDREKLPDCVASGTPIGTVDPTIADELHLPRGVLIAAGAHDQCANSLGSGSLHSGTAMYGMGTFPTIVPVFAERKSPAEMIRLGLNTEHHAVPGAYVSFIYHMGGSTVKWYRDTFAAEEHRQAEQRGEDIYPLLFDEMPEEPGPLLILPHFAPMGPPDFISDSSGVILGLKTATTRGEILKSVLEANNFAHRMTVDRLGSVGIAIDSMRAVGGGSRSDGACQICANIFNRPVLRPKVTEAGAFGAALLAGFAAGVYDSLESAARPDGASERVFEPEPAVVAVYEEVYERYLRLHELATDFTRELNAWKESSRSPQG